MTKPPIKERLLPWIAVPALAAVLIGLAVLQYRWSGQVSDATRAQMLSNLHVSLTSFRQDFARELGAVAIEIKSVVETSNGAELSEQFHHWQQTAAHPHLVSHIYLWQDPAHQQPLRFDPADGESVKRHGRLNSGRCNNVCWKLPWQIICLLPGRTAAQGHANHAAGLSSGLVTVLMLPDAAPLMAGVQPCARIWWK